MDQEQQAKLETVALTVAQGERVYIVAPTYREAEEWRRENLPLLNPQLLRAVVRPEAFRGTRNAQYIVVNGLPQCVGCMRQELEMTEAVCLGRFNY